MTDNDRDDELRRLCAVQAGVTAADGYVLLTEALFPKETTHV